MEKFGVWHLAGDGGMEETVHEVEVDRKGGGNGLMIYGYHLTGNGSVLGLGLRTWSEQLFNFGDRTNGKGIKFTMYFGGDSGHQLAFLSSWKPQGGFGIGFHWDKNILEGNKGRFSVK